MATARWVFPVPVPPTSTMLRLLSRKSPPASSWIRGSLTGEAAKSKSASSLAVGSLADVIWYLIPHFPSIVDIQCDEKAILL